MNPVDFSISWCGNGTRNAICPLTGQPVAREGGWRLSFQGNLISFEAEDQSPEDLRQILAALRAARIPTECEQGFGVAHVDATMNQCCPHVTHLARARAGRVETSLRARQASELDVQSGDDFVPVTRWGEGWIITSFTPGAVRPVAISAAAGRMLCPIIVDGLSGLYSPEPAESLEFPWDRRARHRREREAERAQAAADREHAARRDRQERVGAAWAILADLAGGDMDRARQIVAAVKVLLSEVDADSELVRRPEPAGLFAVDP
jgi:hypothetical protein